MSCRASAPEDVTLRNDDNDLTARIVGADFATDIAVLSASGAGLTPLLFGSVSELDLGDTRSASWATRSVRLRPRS